MKKVLAGIAATIVTALLALVFVYDPIESEAAGKLSAPEIVGKSASEDSVTLEWKGVSSADGYIIYKYNSGKKKYKSIGTVKADSVTYYSYTFSGLKSGKSYKFKIAAYVLKSGQKTAQTKSKIIKIKTTGKDSSGKDNSVKDNSVKDNSGKNDFKADDFYVYDGNGNTVKLSDFAGKPIIVNLWATWCGPCVRELPHFEKLYKEYGDKVVFLMVNHDASNGRYETDYVKEFISRYGYTFPVYYDLDDSANMAYGTGYIPLNVGINKKGEVVYHDSGAFDETRLRNLIDKVME